MRALLIFLLFSFIAFSQTVYVTKSGGKYHTQECRYAKNATAVDLKDVGSRTACSICDASKLVKNSETGSTVTPKDKTAQKEKTGGGQCQATTKKGKQCKRNAKAGSNYCWQHGGQKDVKVFFSYHYSLDTDYGKLY